MDKKQYLDLVKEQYGDSSYKEAKIAMRIINQSTGRSTGNPNINLTKLKNCKQCKRKTLVNPCKACQLASRIRKKGWAARV